MTEGGKGTLHISSPLLPRMACFRGRPRPRSAARSPCHATGPPIQHAAPPFVGRKGGRKGVRKKRCQDDLIWQETSQHVSLGDEAGTAPVKRDVEIASTPSHPPPPNSRPQPPPALQRAPFSSLLSAPAHRLRRPTFCLTLPLCFVSSPLRGSRLLYPHSHLKPLPTCARIPGALAAQFPARHEIISTPAPSLA